MKNFEGPRSEQDQVLQKLSLTDRTGSHWDAQTFYESYVTLSTDFAHGDRLTNLSEAFADAFHKKPGKEETNYEDTYSMSPPKMMTFMDWDPDQGFEATEIIGGNNLALEDKKSTRKANSMGDDGIIHGVQYGPAHMYRIQPNQFAFFPKDKLGENDVIGSEAFSSCTAVIAKTDKGVFFAHVTTDWPGVKQLVASLRDFLGDEQEIHIIRPKWDDESGKYTERTVSYEETWQKTLKELGKIKETTYAYIEQGSKRPKDIHETTIMVANDKIRTVGYYIKPGSRDYNQATAKDITL